MSDTRLIQTYVMYGDKEYFVSTINRKCSTLYNMVYAETLVWEYDRATTTRGDLIGQGEDIKDSIVTHINLVNRLFKTGKCYEVCEDE